MVLVVTYSLGVTDHEIRATSDFLCWDRVPLLCNCDTMALDTKPKLVLNPQSSCLHLKGVGLQVLTPRPRSFYILKDQ